MSYCCNTENLISHWERPFLNGLIKDNVLNKLIWKIY